MKTVVNVLTIGGIALVAILFVYMPRGCNVKKEVQQVAKAVSDSTRYYRDLWGTEHANRLQVVASMDVLKAVNGKKMDSVCRRLNLREKQLESMSEVLLEAKGAVRTTIRYVPVHDTVTGKDYTQQCFDWNDNCVSLQGCVDSSGADIMYGVSVKVTTVTHWKRRWFLGRKRKYIDAYSENPNVRITGLTGIKIN